MKRLAWIWDETRIEFIPDAPLDPLNLSSFLCVFVLKESREGTPTLPRVVTATTSAASHPQLIGVPFSKRRSLLSRVRSNDGNQIVDRTNPIKLSILCNK